MGQDLAPHTRQAQRVEALHTLRAYASNARLVLGQVSVSEKANEITAIPDLLDHRAEAGHLKVTATTVEEGHSHIETRVVAASGEVDWIPSDRFYPRFGAIKSS